MSPSIQKTHSVIYAHEKYIGETILGRYIIDSRLRAQPSR